MLVLSLKTNAKALLHKAGYPWSFNGQGFANFLQVVALFIAVVSFIRYFEPEQELKQTQKELKQTDAAKREAELALVIAKNERQLLIEANRRELTSATAEREKAETARDAAVDEARTAKEAADAIKKELSIALLELKDTKGKQIALEGELRATRAANATAEATLKLTRASVVAIRQEARSRVAGVLPRYIGVRCSFNMQNFTKCAMDVLSTGEFAGVFAKKEMQTAMGELKAHASPLEEEWRLRSQKVQREAAQLMAACATLTKQPDKSECERDAASRGLTPLQNSIDHSVAEAWVAERLKPWLLNITKNPGCPRLGRDQPLRDEWEADCL